MYNDADTHTYTVSQITSEIKEVLETSIPPVWIEGEISNFVHHSSGHMYFSLKDAGAQISCVMWRSRNASLFFTPQNGMKVNLFGGVKVYEKRGNYQIDVTKMGPSGIGDLQMAFEQLKEKLFDEGLFSDEYKQPLPEIPFKIGIITSPTGAALHDMLNVISRRFPAAQLVLRPTLVQGEGAAKDIVQAVVDMNQHDFVDVILLGRGGGSLEDLWPFNEEIVARAVFASKIPIVSAVGHEVDFTICDFVADMRAPTPSAAAEIVVPETGGVLNYVNQTVQNIQSIVEQKVDYNREKLKTIDSHYALKRPGDMVLQFRQRLDEVIHVRDLSLNNQFDKKRSSFDNIVKRLDSANPESILKRGYSICQSDDSGEIITDVSSVKNDDLMAIQFYKGGLKTRVVEINPDAKLENKRV